MLVRLGLFMSYCEHNHFMFCLLVHKRVTKYFAFFHACAHVRTTAPLQRDWRTRLQRSILSIQMLIKEHSVMGSFSETLKLELCMNLFLDVDVTQ